MPTEAKLVQTTLRSLTAIAAIAWAGGCDSRTAGYPALGDVSGQVTEGGQPVANVMVMFQPLAPGRASAGTTDASGRYTLQYTDVARGAMVGEHVVSLTEVVDDTDPKATLRSRKGLNRTFSCTVQPGRNTFDIDLNASPSP